MALVAVASMAVLAACSGSPSKPAFVVPPKPSAKLVIKYDPGEKDVSPGDPVTVSVMDGSLETVKLSSNLGDVPGEFSTDFTMWRSVEDLAYGKTYTLSVSSLGTDGKPVEDTRSFSTVSVDQGHYWSVAFSSGGGKQYSVPLNNGTFGVGQPIIARFDDVVDKSVAESHLKVTTTPVVEGSWSWISDREVHWRPKTYWPANTKVTVEARILGVSLTSPQGGRILYGKENTSATFTIGRSRVAKVDNNTHQMQVFVDGVLARTIPVSMGREQQYKDTAGVWHDYRTLSGIHVVTEKADPVIMKPNLPCPQGIPGSPGCDPGFYLEEVNLAVRFTDSGEYVHSAPWSVASQGHTNVSHGCVNISPANAQWFYGDAIPGDIVQIVNTGAATPSWDGTTDWDVPWDQWVKGSAITKSGTPTAPNQ
jgi:lipoprotein-anchoring transpeptidase ErfK/SrfK